MTARSEKQSVKISGTGVSMGVQVLWDFLL